jgi:hypothetical protein
MIAMDYSWYVELRILPEKIVSRQARPDRSETIHFSFLRFASTHDASIHPPALHRERGPDPSAQDTIGSSRGIVLGPHIPVPEILGLGFFRFAPLAPLAPQGISIDVGNEDLSIHQTKRRDGIECP